MNKFVTHELSDWELFFGFCDIDYDQLRNAMDNAAENWPEEFSCMGNWEVDGFL